jgi:hypothetical protein
MPEKNFTTVKLGERYDGGIVFYINQKMGYFLIAREYDLEDEYTWYDAPAAASSVGPGWYLPNVKELSLLYYKKDLVGNFGTVSPSTKSTFYWSSDGPEGFPNSIWAQIVPFNTGPAKNGYPTFFAKDSETNVRPIKKIFFAEDGSIFNQ